jgi:subtilisin family serine protease
MLNRLTLLVLALGLFLVIAGGNESQPATAVAQTPGFEYTGDVIVKFRQGVTITDVAQAISDADSQAIASSAASGLVLLEPEDGQSLDDAIKALQTNPDVAYAEADTVLKADLMPNDPLANNASYNWSLNEIGAPTAWDTTTGSASVVIAVLDTGVDGTHTDLAGKLNAGRNFVAIGVNNSVNASGTARIRTATAHPYESGESVTIAGHSVGAYNGLRQVSVPITNISAVANVSGAVRITTSAAHQLATGDVVNIRGNSALVTYLGGTTSINRDWIVTVTNATQFTLNSAAYNTAGTGGQAKVASYFNLVGVSYTSAGTGGTATNESPRDDHSHGTFVAGIIAANTNNGTGMAGVCWTCKIMPVKVLDHEGYGTSFGVSQGIDWAVTNGAKVINLSLGGGGTEALQTSVNNAWNAGVIVVAATGNDNGPVSYPAAYANALAVGSTQQGGARSSFSNYGPEIDLVAPGSSVLGTICQCASNAGGYGTGSGTSFSTPYVAGAAGLLIASGVTNKNEIRTQLLSTATDLGTAGFDNLYGNGRLNIGAAIQSEPDTTPPTVNITSPTNGTTVSGNVVIAAIASDDSGIEKVQFSGGPSYLGFDLTPPYTKLWNTNAVSDGQQWVRVRAVDNAGNVSPWVAVSVTVSNNPDSTPPTASITSLTNGQIVSGTINIAANASDNVAVDKVQFVAGGTYLGFDLTSPYAMSWNTTVVPDGPYAVGVRAVDTSGNMTGWIGVTVFVMNTPDTTPPVVSITSPGDGATVSGVIEIAATATDNLAVDKVRFYIDGAYVGYDWTVPYTRTWNTAAVSNGPHTIRAQAVDRAGNLSSNVIITVNVSN